MLSLTFTESSRKDLRTIIFPIRPKPFIATGGRKHNDLVHIGDIPLNIGQDKFLNMFKFINVLKIVFIIGINCVLNNRVKMD